jgi:hypothetical protein
MYYIFILFSFITRFFLKHKNIRLIIELFVLSSLFGWYTLFFSCIYVKYIAYLYTCKTSIFLIKFIGFFMWVWLIIYQGLPYIWFLISYTFMQVYQTKTLDEATELTLKVEPIAFYIKWLFWIFVGFSGYKIGQEYTSKFSLVKTRLDLFFYIFMKPGDLLFYLFWGYVIKVCIILYEQRDWITLYSFLNMSITFL